MPSNERNRVEPWLQGTLTEVPAVLRAVLHALELAREDAVRFCGDLTNDELHARPFGIGSVAFHLKHISRSIDRLLTYAEGHLLSEAQMAALKDELDGSSTQEEVFGEFEQALSRAESRIRAFDNADLEQARSVGRKQLPTTIGGLLVHVADHTQRHVGQAVTTAKIVIAQRREM